jgi:hypothetical protein
MGQGSIPSAEEVEWNSEDEEPGEQNGDCGHGKQNMRYTLGESPNNWVPDQTGKRWYWQVEFEYQDDHEVQRIFFWNAGKTKTGVLKLEDGAALDMSRVRQRIIKLVKNPAYRARFLCPLRFLCSGKVECA